MDEQTGPQQEPPKDKTTAKLSIGAVLDFLTYLNQNPSPLVVGHEYPAERLINVFNAWAADRKIDPNLGDRSTWLAACRAGTFNNDEST